MKETRILMGMPITIEIIDKSASQEAIDKVYDYFDYVDKKFSVYKKDSEISLFNQGKIKEKDFSKDMKEIFELAEITKNETNGYFDIYHDGKYDPSGIVKGWAIQNTYDILIKMGYRNFYVDAGGDIQVSGKNAQNKNWKIGIRNPFNSKEIIKTLSIFDKGVATSGTYVRGQHIYNPNNKNKEIKEIVAITVIGLNVYEADRFATAAFAMGKEGVNFIEKLPGFEVYMIDNKRIATYTSGFKKYVWENHENNR